MPKHKEPTRSPRIGASYRAGTKALEVMAPVTDELASSIQARNFKTFPTSLKDKAWTTAYGANLLVATADAALDSKMGHSAALSRGSVTAWIPEVMRLSAASAAGLGVFGGTSRDFRGAHGAFVEAGTAYNPNTGTWNPQSGHFVAYQGAKRVGQIVRKLASSNVGRRVFGPAKKAFGAMGVSL